MSVAETTSGLLLVCHTHGIPTEHDGRNMDEKTRQISADK